MINIWTFFLKHPVAFTLRLFEEWEERRKVNPRPGCPKGSADKKVCKHGHGNQDQIVDFSNFFTDEY